MFSEEAALKFCARPIRRSGHVDKRSEVRSLRAMLVIHACRRATCWCGNRE